MWQDRFSNTPFQDYVKENGKEDSLMYPILNNTGSEEIAQKFAEEKNTFFGHFQTGFTKMSELGSQPGTLDDIHVFFDDHQDFGANSRLREIYGMV